MYAHMHALNKSISKNMQSFEFTAFLPPHEHSTEVAEKSRTKSTSACLFLKKLPKLLFLKQ